MSEEFHPPVDEYLEAIRELEEEGTRVIRARLAERLGHSPPTVTEMIRRLDSEGYLVIAGRDISLTSKGEQRAESVVRRHRLAERLLTDVLGLPWDLAHSEACKWEHVISDVVEERIMTLLGNPTTCPHGNPIPGTKFVEPDLTALNEIRVDGDFMMTRVSEDLELDPAMMRALNEAGATPGRQVRVSVAGGKGSRGPDIEVSGELGKVLVSESQAKSLFVSPLEP